MEELNLDFGGTKDRTVKQGRRALHNVSNDAEGINENGSVTQSRVTSTLLGWGEQSLTSNKTSHLPESKENENAPSDDEGDDIPVIPDLEDQHEDIIVSKIASAPVIAVNRVATYRELDSDLSQAAFLTLDDEIDLKILARGLVRESDLIEDDRPWDWEHLFTEVSSELQQREDKSAVEPER